ncbi:MAG: lycopene cyclase domain-containing protein [Bacteroidales bacterium]|nr:lycopene cyclase domain-containing protein [Bacteroidales bacterium]
MEITRFTYLFLLVLTLGYPLYKSFEPRIRFHTKFRYVLPSIVLTAIPFLIWDVLFEQSGIWHFNPDYTIGVFWLGLPLEEWLFFFIIPFACFFIYEVVLYFTGTKPFPYIKHFTFILAIGLLIIAILSSDRTYTFVNFLLGAVLLLLMLAGPLSSGHITGFYKGFAVSLVPFLIVNGALTKIPVVLYNNTENLSLRIYSIPVEDSVYLLSLLFINFWLYETLKRYAHKKQTSSESRG